MAIYRDFDQTALDTQYNCGGMVPDAQDHVAGWVSESARARASLACDLDVAYGAGTAERLDIFPAGTAGAPVMVFIHGGYWRSMDKSDNSFPALAFVPSGVALVSINYALTPMVRLEEIVEQCRGALAWVWRNATSFGGDASRLYVSGHSAGGHLTAMMMATDWPEWDGDLPADMIKGGAPISGLYDLEPIRLTYLNDDVRLDAAEARRNSPIHHAPRGPRWMAITTGGAESSEFHRQQAELVARWSETELKTNVVDAPGLHHFNVVSQLGDPESAYFQAVREAIARDDEGSR